MPPVLHVSLWVLSHTAIAIGKLSRFMILKALLPEDFGSVMSLIHALRLAAVPFSMRFCSFMNWSLIRWMNPPMSTINAGVIFGHQICGIQPLPAPTTIRHTLARDLHERNHNIPHTSRNCTAKTQFKADMFAASENALDL